ncbi:MAG: ferritin-like domain-containing protein [Pseudomonadota bacterium]
MGLDLAIDNAAARARLARLLAKGQKAESLDGKHVCWDLPVKVPIWLSRKRYFASISRVYQGERATAKFCGALAEKINDPLVRDCLRVQMEDEQRHAVAYGRYLEKLDLPFEADPVLAEAYGAACGENVPPQVQMLAYHVILENEALELQRTMRWLFPCRLLAQINSRVSRDEARHVAFGKIFLDGRFDHLDPAQRAEIYFWLKGLWHDCARATVRGLGGRLFVWAAKVLSEFDRCWSLRAKDLVDVGLITSAELVNVDHKVSKYLRS